jgi:hypothetical protein
LSFLVTSKGVIDVLGKLRLVLHIWIRDNCLFPAFSLSDWKKDDVATKPEVSEDVNFVF